ncbi:MAG: hypothetical protein SGARI_005323, partial [Bacillariaceae sp.]
MKRLQCYVRCWLTFVFVPTLVAAVATHDKSLRNLQAEGDNDCVTANKQEFYLLELFGTRSTVTTNDLDQLGESFVNAVTENQNAVAADVCEYTSLNVAIWNDVMAEDVQDVDIIQEVDDPLEEELQETFSFIMMVEYEQCVLQEDCIQVSMVRGGNANNRQRSLRQVQETACGCQPMPLDDLLQAWNRELASNAVSEV